MTLKKEGGEVRRVKAVDKKKKQQQKKRDVEGDSPPLYSRTKEQTKNHGHLITKALDQREREPAGIKRDGRGHEVHLSICVRL